MLSCPLTIGRTARPASLAVLVRCRPHIGISAIHCQLRTLSTSRAVVEASRLPVSSFRRMLVERSTNSKSRRPILNSARNMRHLAAGFARQWACVDLGETTRVPYRDAVSVVSLRPAVPVSVWFRAVSSEVSGGFAGLGIAESVAVSERFRRAFRNRYHWLRLTT